MTRLTTALAAERGELMPVPLAPCCPFWHASEGKAHGPACHHTTRKDHHA